MGGTRDSYREKNKKLYKRTSSDVIPYYEDSEVSLIPHDERNYEESIKAMSTGLDYYSFKELGIKSMEAHSREGRNTFFDEEAYDNLVRSYIYSDIPIDLKRRKDTFNEIYSLEDFREKTLQKFLESNKSRKLDKSELKTVRGKVFFSLDTGSSSNPDSYHADYSMNIVEDKFFDKSRDYKKFSARKDFLDSAVNAYMGTVREQEFTKLIDSCTTRVRSGKNRGNLVSFDGNTFALKMNLFSIGVKLENIPNDPEKLQELDAIILRKHAARMADEKIASIEIEEAEEEVELLNSILFTNKDGSTITDGDKTELCKTFIESYFN